MSSRTVGRQGPLADVRVVEFAGIGPAPFACMLMSDMGADIVTVDRPAATLDPTQIVNRGRTVVRADLKDPQARASVLELIDGADILVEGFRPKVMERLGLGPEEVAKRNRRLVYARMTGWGQDGPLSQAAGHDINYIAITGALNAIGTREQPLPPLNLVGDYGGGSLYLVVGILAALHEARRSGEGQVVDAAITDGVISMMTNFVGRNLRGAQKNERASNMLDGGAPYYRTYATADGQHVSVGPIEKKFFAEFCQKVGVPRELTDAQHDETRWPDLASELQRIFMSATQEEWVRRLEGTDCCFAPVVSLKDAPFHAQNAARASFVEVDGILQPAPAPRFSRTPSAVQGAPAKAASQMGDVLARWAHGI